MKNEAFLYVELEPGRCLEFRVRSIEEAMPNPHERPSFREPTFDELERALAKLGWRCPQQPPFPIADAVALPASRPAVPLHSRLPARSGKAWWLKLFS